MNLRTIAADALIPGDVIDAGTVARVRIVDQDGSLAATIVGFTDSTIVTYKPGETVVVISVQTCPHCFGEPWRGCLYFGFCCSDKQFP